MLLKPTKITTIPATTDTSQETKNPWTRLSSALVFESPNNYTNQESPTHEAITFASGPSPKNVVLRGRRVYSWHKSPRQI